MKNHEALCQNHKCVRKDNCKRYIEILNKYQHTGNFHQICDEHNRYKYFRSKDETL